MEHELRTLKRGEFPPLLYEISEPPQKLYIKGALPSKDHTYLTVVGSRHYSTYGKQVVDTLIGALKGQPVSIVSGLALGIDRLAHEAALSYGLHTISVPGSGLDDTVLYPKSHKRLARRILENGGALLSEFEPTFEAVSWSFPKRNRIMAGIAPATLVIEATKQSGTLITARLAVDYNRDLLVVPGSIFARNTAGPHLFLRLGAIPITAPDDLLQVLGLTPTTKGKHTDLDLEEKKVVDILVEPLSRDELIQKLKMDVQRANVLLASMELRGLIEERHGHIQMV